MSLLFLGIRQGLVNGPKIQAAPKLFPSIAVAANYPINIRQTYQQSLVQSTQTRSIFSDSALGLEKLDELQGKKNQLFAGAAKDRYVDRLRAFLDNGDIKSVYRDDLINLMGIIEKDDHLLLLEDLIEKTKDEHEALFQGWGTTVMRIYYKMGKIDRAIENLKDTDRFGNFFDQRLCFKIVMSMLYNAGRYREVVDIYHLADQRITQRFPGGCEQLLAPAVFAALAKINTKEAFEEARELFTKLDKLRPERGASRSTLFIAYMAVNHNEPKYALNLISKLPHGNYVTSRELKIRCLIKLERYEDILYQLREFMESIKPNTSMLLKNTYELIEECMSRIDDSTVQKELQDILVQVKDGGHVSDANLEELLFNKINDPIRPPFNMRDGENDSGQGSRPFRRYRDGGSYNRQYNNYQDNRRAGYNDDRSYNNRNRDRSYYNDSQGDYDNDNRQEEGRYRQKRDPNKSFTYQNVDFSS